MGPDGGIFSPFEKDDPRFLAVVSDRVNAELTDRVRALTPVDAGHDFHHTLRVSRLCMQIYAAEHRQRLYAEAGIDSLAAAYTCGLLHDCHPVPKNSELRAKSAD